MKYGNQTVGVDIRVLKKVMVAMTGVCLLTLSAKLNVPFWPVPMTMQVFALLAIAGLAGRAMALQIFAAYLVAGAVGLPVFAGTPEKGIGLAYMFGPTGGYLLGMLVASALVGHAAQFGKKGMLLPSMLAGLAIIYAVGLAWLSYWVPADKLLAAGFYPFVIGDIVKIATAALLVILVPQSLKDFIRGEENNG